MRVVSIRADAVSASPDEKRLARMLTSSFMLDYIPPDPNGHYSLPPCLVQDCGRVAHSGNTRLCSLHRRARALASERVPEADWAQDAAAQPTWKTGDDPAARAASRGVFVLAPLAGLMRLEVAYGLQCRATGLPIRRARAFVVNDLVRRLATQSRIKTLLDDSAEDIVRELGVEQSGSSAVGFIRTTQGDLRAALDRPGRRSVGLRGNGTPYFVDESGSGPAWLGPLVKRWLDYRLAVEAVQPHTAGEQAAALHRFGSYLVANNLARPDQVTRTVLIGYIRHLKDLRKDNGEPFASVTVGKWMSAVSLFLDDVRAHEWDNRVPGNARFLNGEFPRRPPSQPRFISEYVMAKVERPESLDRIEREDIRLAVKIIMTTGMRMIHALTLPLNCLEQLPRQTGEPAWCLSFLDTKTRQAMRVPLRSDVAEAVRRQQQVVRSEHGDECPYLLPRPRDAAMRHIPPQTFHQALTRWCASLALTDENGAPVRITAHRFRHTCGTRWINNNVPQRVVMKLLGHRTERMVGVYAHLHDETVREEWEAFERININGERVSPPDSEVAEVEWMLENLSRATQALPNGYCALPLQQSCPHANACLTCDSFTTDRTFLPILEQQRDHHAEMITQADELGHTRMAEINRRPFISLNKIIMGLRPFDKTEEADAS